MGEDSQTSFSWNNINSSRVHPPEFVGIKIKLVSFEVFFYFHFEISKNGTFTLKLKIWPPHFWFASSGPVKTMFIVIHFFQTNNN